MHVGTVPPLLVEAKRLDQMSRIRPALTLRGLLDCHGCIRQQVDRQNKQQGSARKPMQRSEVSRVSGRRDRESQYPTESASPSNETGDKRALTSERHRSPRVRELTACPTGGPCIVTTSVSPQSDPC